MDRSVQNAIIKNPIPILIGNTSLQPSGQYEYFYTDAYIVDDQSNKNMVIFYDKIDDNWRLFTTNTNNYFSQLSGFRNILTMNGFANNEAGYPNFIYRYDAILGERYICYNKFHNTWSSSLVKSINKKLYTYYSIDIADEYYGGSFYGDGQVISSFQQNVPILQSLTRQEYVLFEGDPSVKNSILKFKNADDEVISGKIIPNQYSIGRSDTRSPQIISGEPCLGYYFNNENDMNELPYVVGSLCIGTSDLTTVPPLVGQNTLTSLDGIHSRDVLQGKLNGRFYTDAFVWLATTIDKTKDEWNLFQIKHSYGSFLVNDLVLIKGNHNMYNPSNATQYWRASGSSFGSQIFQYSNWKNGVLFRAIPSGSNITLNIVGLTSYNADAVKHPGTQANLNTPTYIGNWISPQAKWRSTNA